MLVLISSCGVAFAMNGKLVYDFLGCALLLLIYLHRPTDQRPRVIVRSGPTILFDERLSAHDSFYTVSCSNGPSTLDIRGRPWSVALYPAILVTNRYKY